MPRLKVEDFKHKNDEELYRIRPNIILGTYIDEDRTEITFKDGKFAMQRFKSSIASRQIFRESVSNAIDNVRRAMTDNDIDPGVINIDIQEQEGDNPIFTITNGGHVPPFEMTTLRDGTVIPVPQAIVGVFKVSTNYEDEDDEETAAKRKKQRLGGQNGIGSKAANLFSKWFELTIVDAENGKKYFQRFEDFKPREPVITETKAKKNSFKIRYQPNKKLGTVNIYWFACDVIYAAITSYDKVFLTINDDTYDLSGLQFKDILGFYPSALTGETKINNPDDEEEQESETPEENKETEEKEETEASERKKRDKKKKIPITKTAKVINGPEFPTILLHWKDKLGNEVIVADVHQKFQFPRVQGWVNGIPCSRGIHIQEAEKVFIKALKEKLSTLKDYSEKLEKLKLPPKIIRSNILLLAKVEIEGTPSFGAGQIKDHFIGPKVDLSLYDKNKPNPQKEPEKWGNWKDSYLLRAIKEHWKSESEKKLSQTDGKKTKHVGSKYYTAKANWAGSDKSEACSFLYNEGDSAKTYANEWRAAHPNGNNEIGIFTSRGKVLNVLNASMDQLLDNEIFTEMKKVLGLREGVDYTDPENIKTLRYGKEFIIMTDSDDDGAHIRGLVLLFFHTRYPTLLKRGYVTAFFSPVIRVFLPNETYRFYRFEAYQRWLKEDPSRGKAKTKYYKGLASSKTEDIIEDFKVAKKITYKLDKSADDYMTLAFNDAYSDARKEWIIESEDNDEDVPDHIQKISDFVDKELIVFFKTSIRRAIPALDGFKDVQRKLVWALRNTKKAARANILATRAIEATKYHHGPQAIEKTLMLMVQNFAGTNNLPLFVADGQFGSRRDPKPPAARYPNTHISPLYDKIFPKIDENLLVKKYEEGEEIEPELLAPIIPLALVNGSKGVGTGWSTEIPAHEPRAVISNMKRIIRGQKFIKMIPWYNHYNGVIQMTETGFRSKGILERRGKSWRVTELPLFFWTKDFEDHLKMLLKPDTNDPYQPAVSLISDYKQNNAKTDAIDYTIDGPTIATFEKLAKEEAKRNKTEYRPREPLDDEDLYDKVFKLFKLEAHHSMKNMVLLVNGIPKHFETVEGVMREFYNYRIALYEKRYTYIIKNIEDTIIELEKKLKIARLFIEQKVNTNDDDLVEKIVKETGLEKKDVDLFLEKNNIFTIVKIAKSTEKGLKKIENDIEKLRNELEESKKKTPADMWLDDLEKLEKALGVKGKKKKVEREE